MYCAFISIILPSFALAAGGTGLAQVDNFFNKVSGWLTGGGLIIMTIAFAIAGYKVMFGSQSIREVTPIIIGGVLIGGGATIASMFFN